MFKRNLPYRLMLMLLTFSLLLIIPISMIIHQNAKRMIDDIGDISPLTTEQKAVHSSYMEKITESFLSLSFYVFILSFIIAIFFSRKILVPVKELYRGARALKDGMLDIRLDVSSEDELGEVTKAFNDMAVSLRDKAKELLAKNLYINAMLDPLWVVDNDNIVIDVNTAFMKLFGYEKGDIIGSPVYDFLDSENEALMRTQLYNRDEGISSTYSISIISKAGELIPVLISGSPIFSEEGEVMAKIGVMKDFRQELVLRKALKESVDYRDAIMDSMIDSLLVIDKDFRIIIANKAAVVEAGENIIGKFCHTVFHKMPHRCAAHGIYCPVQSVFETGKSFRTVHEHLLSKGEKIFHEIIAYPVKDEKGGVKHAVEIMRDVTEKKRYEDNIARKNKELITLNSIAMLLNQSLRTEDIFNNILDKIIEMTDMSGGAIFFLDEMGQELTCSYSRGLSSDFIPRTQRIKSGIDIPGKVAATGSLFVSSDISVDRRVEKSILKHTGIKAYAGIPLKGKERTLGVMCVFGFSPHVFLPDEEKNLMSIGEMTGIAVENIRLYEKMRGLYDLQKQRRAEEQRNLLSLSSQLAARLDITEVLGSTLMLIKSSMKADFIWLLEVDPDGNLILRSAPEGGIAEGGVIYPAEASSIELFALESKKPLIITELPEEARFSMHPGLVNFRSCCSIPIYVGDRSIGVFSLYYSLFKEPKEEDIYFLQTVAGMLYVSIERSRLHEKAALEKGLADTILDSINDGILTVGRNGRIISLNQAAMRIIGLPAKAVIGTLCCSIFDFAEENSELRSKLEDCLLESIEGKFSNCEAELFNAEEKTVPLSISSAPVRDRKDNVVGVVYVLRDVSRDKEIDRMKTEFVRTVSHEFRTPLSAIVGMTEMLMDEVVEGDREKDYLKTILSEGKRLSRMVSDLLDLARIESGKEVFREEEVDFSMILDEVWREFRPALEKKKGRFSFKTEGDVKGYKGDAELLLQLFRNLVENSISYSDAGVSVDILIKSVDNENMDIIVSDTGWGISVDDLRHIGDKFYRGAMGAKTKGTGLGLSLCREILRLHGGQIHIESKTGEGARVTASLPLRRKQ
jgi:PAS domain S-box-containing protein